MCWPKGLRVWQISTFGAEDPAGLFHGILRRHWELDGCKVATVARVAAAFPPVLHVPSF